MRKILIVDEDVAFADSVKSTLKKLHYNVIVTNTCREVMDILFFFKPDLFFVSTTAGNGDCTTLFKQIQAKKEYQNTPVIMTTRALEISSIVDLAKEHLS